MFRAGVCQFTKIHEEALVAVLLCLGRFFTASIIVTIFQVLVYFFICQMLISLEHQFQASFAFSLG